MGVGLTTCFEAELPDAGSFANGTDGKTVAALIPLLDALAVARGFAPFSRFIPDLDDIDWEEVDVNEVPELWFDPADGLKIVSALIEGLALLTSPGARDADWPKPVRKLKRLWGEQFSMMTDQAAASLSLLAQDLDAARKAGIRFSLTYA